MFGVCCCLLFVVCNVLSVVLLVGVGFRAARCVQSAVGCCKRCVVVCLLLLRVVCCSLFGFVVVCCVMFVVCCLLLHAPCLLFVGG